MILKKKLFFSKRKNYNLYAVWYIKMKRCLPVTPLGIASHKNGLTDRRAGF